MANDTDVANRALLSLGLRSIDDFDTATSYRARQIRLLYDGTRISVLEEYDWPFAAARAELVRNATVPVSGFEFSYNLPADFLRMRHVRASADDDDVAGGHYVGDRYSCADLPYELSEPTLQCSAEEVFIAYTKNVDDLTLWPQHVAEILAFRLAKDVAIALTESETKRAEAERMHNSAVVRARGISTDNNVRRKPKQQSSGWLAARYQGSGVSHH